jgi:hypothetical protein
MSGSVNGNGGTNGLFKFVPRTGGAPSQTGAAGGSEGAPKTAADTYSSSSGGPSVLGRSLEGLVASAGGPLSVKDRVKAAKDLPDLVSGIVRDEFPGLKMNPVQTAKMNSWIMDQLAQRGITAESFQGVKNSLG